MKQNITLATAILCGLLFSCKEAAKNETPIPQKAKTYTQLEKARWVLGEWGNTTPEGELTERWKQENDSVYTGETYFVTGGKDTVFSESIRLEEVNGKLTYIATVPGQNNGKPVAFEMTSATENQIIFENPQHDFPSKITYNKISLDSMVAVISGTKDGKPASEQFAMKKR